MLKIENLSSGYEKDLDVIKDISFEIFEGEITILMGENGSGKSTLFKTILGLIKPKSGSINYDDINLNNISNKKRASIVAYVPQNNNLPPLTVYETILLGRIPYYNYSPSLKDKEVVDKVIAELNLEDIKNKNANMLSGGEKQLVNIARAIAQEPKILIFDEPNNNLDISNELLLFDLIKKIAKEKNIAILISLHDLNLSYDLGDKFIFLKDGKIISEGDKKVFTEDVILKTFNEECLIITQDDSTYIKFKKRK